MGVIHEKNAPKSRDTATLTLGESRRCSTCSWRRFEPELYEGPAGVLRIGRGEYSNLNSSRAP